MQLVQMRKRLPSTTLLCKFRCWRLMVDILEWLRELALL